MRSKRLFRRSTGQEGYALLSVIGFGTAIVLTVGAVGGYAVQAMQSAGRAQGYQAAIQAAQAGVDDFVSRLTANPAYGSAPNTAWQPVAGSTDGEGNACVGTDATLPPNCPRFKHSAVSTATGWTVTSVGKSRGQQRAVQVLLKKRAFTDYLYFSDIEAADPADNWAYPSLLGLGGAPANCGNPAWGPNARPATGCKVPTWRGGDSTEGSRVHTDDVFEVVGSPRFESKVTASIAACATDATACVRKTYDAGADPDYEDGLPAYADDLDMPANGLAQIAANAGCTYYGPTRIHFEGTNQMRVWSPQTPYSAACGGGVDPTMLNSPINVVVSTANRAGICTLLGAVTQLVCNLLYPLGSIVQLPLSNVLSNSLLTGTGLLQAVSGLVSPGTLVTIPAGGAIYVKDNAVGDAIPDPTFIQCLVGSVVGMYGTLDTNVTAGLLNASGTVGSNCRSGKLFVDGVLDGKVTVGVSGDILITSDLTYKTSDNADNDRLGLVATGPVEVYNSLQCTLAVGTCLSLTPLSTSLQSALTGLASGSGNLNSVLGLVPGYGDDITIDASIISLQHRFGMQLPILSLALNATLLNQLVNLNIDPPKLRLHGSLAQRYRGIISADLLNLNLGVPSLNLAGVNVDIGYDFEMEYDEKLRTDAPPFLPAPDSNLWDAQSFAEVKPT